ncbi:cache domain-containing protein [Burkholderia cenocepacia]|uniref:cache domain-containing protein n=1 Tax=Burkholderia cenocepacia TaxID=95486 RepID=UPI0007611271|nr:cache domain-containing protein [Burkholderia cenocepacia]KWU26403.1 hypothetical protein AS149_25790 [Burkholderia cenocepacia]
MLFLLRKRVTLTCVALAIGALLCAVMATHIVAGADDPAMRSRLADVLHSSSRSIDLWVLSRSRMVSKLNLESFAEDPKGVLKQLEAAGGFVVAFAGYPDGHSVFSRRVVTPDGFDPTARPWYREAVDAGRPLITSPYVDASTKRLVVTFTKAFVKAGELKAVVGADVNLDGIESIVAEIHPTPTSFAFLVDSDGRVLAHPDSAQRMKPAAELSPSLSPGFLATLATQPIEHVDIRNRLYSLAASPILGTNWKLVVAQDETESEVGFQSSADASALTLTVLVAAGAAIVSLLMAFAIVRKSQFRAIRAAMTADDSGGPSGVLSTGVMVGIARLVRAQRREAAAMLRRLFQPK